MILSSDSWHAAGDPIDAAIFSSESIIIPIPVDPLLVAVVLAKSDHGGALHLPAPLHRLLAGLVAGRWGHI